MLGSVARRFFRGLLYAALSFVFVYVANFLQTEMVLGMELTPIITALLLAADKAVRFHHG